MASLLLKLGKGALDKKSGKQSKGTGDTYTYYDINKHGKKEEKPKKLKYFLQLGIPEHDAIVLEKVMKRARGLDGRQFLGLRFGWSGVIQLLPEIGDIIDGLLSMSIIKTASKVSGGLDEGYHRKMVQNVIIEVAIGLVPVLGDLVDSLFFQANTRNAHLLEQMLIERVKALKELEKSGHAPVPNHTHEHYGRHARTATPPGYDDRHAGVHKRLQSRNKSVLKLSDHASGGGSKSRGWLGKLQNRGNRGEASEDVRPYRPLQPRPATERQGRMRDDAVPPARPPRPGSTRHHQAGSF